MKTKRILTPIIMYSLCATLAGCNSPKPQVVNYTYIPTQNKLATATDYNAQASLAQSASTTSTSLNELSAVQQATHPQTQLDSPLNAKSIGMAEHASITWNGPVESILNNIATRTHYKLSIIGNKPATPVIVILHERNKTLAQILRNIAYQVANANRGRIKVYPSQRVIELRYNNH